MFEPKSFQDTFIPVPVCPLQILQQLGSLVNEPAQAPPVRNVPFEFAEVVPDIAYLKGQQRGYRARVHKSEKD